MIPILGRLRQRVTSSRQIWDGQHSKTETDRKRQKETKKIDGGREGRRKEGKQDWGKEQEGIRNERRNREEKGRGERERAKIKCFNSRKRFPLCPQSKLWRQEKFLDSCMVCFCLHNLLTELNKLANLEFYPHTSCLWDKLSPLGLPYLSFPLFPKGNASSKVPNPRVDIRWQPRSSRWSELGTADLSSV